MDIESRAGVFAQAWFLQNRRSWLLTETNRGRDMTAAELVMEYRFPGIEVLMRERFGQRVDAPEADVERLDVLGILMP